jgi:hypothetical protein
VGVFERRPLTDAHQGQQPHPLRRQIGVTIALAALLAIAVLLLLPPHAHGLFG